MRTFLSRVAIILGIISMITFVCPQRTVAQRMVKGVVVDSLTHAAIPYANAVLFKSDSSFIGGAATDTAGVFRLRLSDKNAYIIRVTMIGYKTRYIDIPRSRHKETVSLDTIALTSTFVELRGAVVKGVRSDMEIKEDTVVFNAGEYNVSEGEALEELVKLLPGVEVDGNTITYNGKEVQDFRINGKDFFKGRKKMAMKNLPVDLVKSIKTYEQKSDYAEQTGIDDGNEQTVMDIELKKELNETWIANLDAAVGSQGRYIEKIFANRITDLSRLTFNGNMKNDDARSTDKHFGVDFNMNNRREKKEAGRVEVGGNFVIDNNHSHSETWRAAENFVSSGKTSSFSNSNTYAKNRSKSMTGNVRMEWLPDTMTTVTIRNSFSYGRSHNFSRSRSARFSGDPYAASLDNDPLDAVFDEDFSSENMADLYSVAVNRNARYSKNDGHNFSYNFSAMGVRRLGTKGRNVSLDLNASVGNNKSKYFRISDIHYYNKKNGNENTYTNQYTNTPSKHWNFNVRASYNEPVFKGGYLQFSYRFERSHNKNDRSIFELDSLDGWRTADEHELGELPLTKDSLEMAFNVFNSTYSTYEDWKHSGNLSFRINKRKLNMNVGTGVLRQITHLDYRKNDIDTTISRKLVRFTPSAFMRYRISRHERFEVRYSGWSSDPAMTNRLGVIDDTDPLNIHISNTSLKPAWNNRVRFEYDKFIVKRQQNYAVNAQFNQSSNNISTAVIYDEETGVRTTMPKNINGNWSASSNFIFSTAIGSKKAFRLYTNTRGAYSNSVSYVSTGSKSSSEKNTTKTSSIWNTANLRYRAQTFEARVGWTVSYRHSDNKLRPQSDLNTFNYSYSADAKVRFPWKMTVDTDIKMQSRRGYANKSMNTDELIWNATVSQNFFRGSPLIIRFKIYDILHERNDITRTINAQSRVDTQNDVSYSYFMLHAILRLNIFNGKISSGFKPKGKKNKAAVKYDRDNDIH